MRPMDAFAALADPIRRQIITRLASGELSAGEIASAFAITSSAVSQHLKVLKEANLVRVRIEGQRRLYRLEPDRFENIREWLAEPAAPRRTAKPIATFVDATDLVAWADRRNAQAFLSGLLRRLILATAPHASRVGFRSGEGIQLAGWDGIVTAKVETAFVPKGASAWEMGTNQNPRTKAQDDYSKRTQNSQGIDPAQTTFVFVTPRRWPGKSAWEAERRAEGVWRDVRVYDADDMETWLETAPAVHVWLSVRLGTHPKDALDLESIWGDWSHSTDPPITMQFVLAGRKGLATKVVDWLVKSSETTLALRAESCQEALAVFAAIILDYSGSEREWLLSRTVVVDSVATWNALTLSNETLILIPRFEDDAALGRARRAGHRVVVALGAESTSGSSEEVRRLARGEAEEALRDMGVKEKQVRRLVSLARRSMNCFRRELALRPEIHRPQWTHSGEGRRLVPALLAGVWSDTSEADRAVLSTLARCDYEVFSDSVSQWVGTSDPPLRRVGDVFELVSREDSWFQLVRYVRREDLDRFRQVVLDVLGVHDPQFDLPLEERWLAGIHGQVPAHSSGLRKGLAATLAIMGARGEDLTVAGGLTLRQRAESIVNELLGRANQDMRLWLSLSRLLPLLAEAAPDVFLEAVEGGLGGDDPPVMELFVKAPDPLFGSASHTGLLWALESLAWSPDYLARASLVLGSLARLDPGGGGANRPAASLRAIFLPWLPQTTAKVKMRLDIIDRIRQRAPDVAWKLMQELLPQSHGIAHPSAKPQWREWAPDEEPRVTRGEFFEVTNRVLQRMLEDVGALGARWEDLISALADLPLESYRMVVDRLGNLAANTIEEPDRVGIWSALRTILSRHRSYSDAQWALSADRLDPLDALLDQFAPQDFSARFGWLFADSVDLPQGMEQDWIEKEQAVEAARLNAAREIHEARGLAGLLALVPSLESPRWLGVTLVGGDFVGDDAENAILSEHLAHEDSKKSDFALGIVLAHTRTRDIEWVKTKVLGPGREWSAKQRGMLLSHLQPQPSAWELVSKTDAETEQEYWRALNPWKVEEEHVEYIVRKLLEHDRPFTATHVLNTGLRNGADVSQALIADVLEKAIRTDPSEDPDRHSFSLYAAQLLDRLVSGDMAEDRIARIEWAYQPLLRFGREPKFLQRELGRNPLFFAEILSLVYRTEGEEPGDVSEEKETKSRLGHDLLDSWHTPPGSTEDGYVNAQELREWVDQARSLVAESGRGPIGDVVIGKVLSGSPRAPDGSWPVESIRDVIENVASNDLESGFEVGTFNSERVVIKNPAEGGEHERQLAKRYEKDAKAVRDRWPRTAAMLRRLAEMYRVQARREDDRSELLGSLDS